MAGLIVACARLVAKNPFDDKEADMPQYLFQVAYTSGSWAKQVHDQGNVLEADLAAAQGVQRTRGQLLLRLR